MAECDPASGVVRLRERLDAVWEWAFGNGKPGADETLRRHDEWITDARDMRKLIFTTLIVGLISMTMSGLAAVAAFAGRMAMTQNQHMSSAGDATLFKPWLTANELGRLYEKNADTINRWRMQGDPRVPEYRLTATGYEYRNPLMHEPGTGTKQGQTGHETGTP